MRDIKSFFSASPGAGSKQQDAAPTGTKAGAGAPAAHAGAAGGAAAEPLKAKPLAGNVRDIDLTGADQQVNWVLCVRL